MSQQLEVWAPNKSLPAFWMIKMLLLQMYDSHQASNAVSVAKQAGDTCSLQGQAFQIASTCIPIPYAQQDVQYVQALLPNGCPARLDYNRLTNKLLSACSSRASAGSSVADDPIDTLSESWRQGSFSEFHVQVGSIHHAAAFTGLPVQV